MENILGWRSQYDRMERWRRRILSRGEGCISDQDLLDFYLAFFVSSYALRDWLVNSGIIPAADIDRLIHADRAMRLCRDLCNRSKHFRISRPSVDASFSILREYRGDDQPNALAVIAGSEKRDLWDVVDGCVQFWATLIRDRRLPDPPSPFARNSP